MAQMKNHRHLPAFILLDLVQHENHGECKSARIWSGTCRIFNVIQPQCIVP